MANITAKVIIKESPDVVFDIISKMDSFAYFISGVKEIKILSETKTKRVSEWQIDVAGTNVKWQEEQIISPNNRTIFFRMIDGDYANYEGYWKVGALNTESIVELCFDIEWELEFEDKDYQDVLSRKANLAARWALREIRKKIGLGKVLSSSSLLGHNKISSELFEIFNRRGKRIVGYHDRVEATAIDSPYLIIMPGYGETKRDALYISYFFAKNGFNVLRYDATDHTGESEGVIYDVTLTKFKDDLLDVILYVKSKVGNTPIAVLANSLSFRSALKAVASSEFSISMLIGFVGVINLQETLRSIYKEDIIGDVARGNIKDIYEVLGYEISRNFPVEAITSEFHNLESTITDVSKIPNPIILCQAEKDAWINLDESRVVINCSQHPYSSFHVIPNAMHQLMENPSAFKYMLKQVIVAAAAVLSNRKLAVADVLEPSKKELVFQNRLEKDRLKKILDVTSESEKSFWDSYLKKFSILFKVPDYNKYLSDIIASLNINRDEVKILDVGCGNGYLGAALLSRFSYARDGGDGVPHDNIPHTFDYYGIDRTDAILGNAKNGHSAIMSMLKRQGSINGVAPRLYYDCVDVNEGLSYPNNFFDRVCASLLISYLNALPKSLKEFIRILKPGGLLILSSMKPSADMSQIYRNFAENCRSDDELRLARELLNEAGKIKQKEGYGHYHFFSDKELKTLLFAAGIENIKTFRSFGDQAVVAVGRRRMSKEFAS